MSEAQTGTSRYARVPGSTETDCCDTLCQHACHMTAVAAAATAAIAISPALEAVFEPSDSGLLRFIHPIDHIPLV